MRQEYSRAAISVLVFTHFHIGLGMTNLFSFIRHYEYTLFLLGIKVGMQPFYIDCPIECMLL